MKRANCLIRQSDGSILKKVFFAADLDEIHAIISREQSELLQVLTVRDEESSPARFSATDQIRFFETISTLIGSGLNLQQTMDIAAMLQNDAKSIRIIRGIRADIGKGMPFGDALFRAIPGLPPLISGMVRIGEKIGCLDSVLAHLLAYLRLMHALREKMVSAAMYPALILMLTVVGVVGLSVFFIPQLESSLSGSTAVAATIRTGFNNLRLIMFFMVASVAVLIAGVVVYRISRTKFPTIASAMERALFRVPVIGSVSTSAQLLTLSYSLEVMTQNGVQLDEALRLASESGGSLAFREALGLAAIDLKNGMALSLSLNRQGLFPGYFISWVQIAEQTGKVAQAFGQLRLFYEKELDKLVSRVMVMVEPVLIAGIGIALLGVIMTVIVPLFGIYSMGGK